MRKVIFTEAQLKKILGEDAADYLNNIDVAEEVPDNAYGTQVFVNNIDKDAEDNVTTTDKISRHKNRSNSGGRLFARSRTFESVNEGKIDNNLTRNFGKGEKDGILATSGKGAGKMVNNLAAEIGKGGKGTRHNTNQVRASRLEDEKKNNPALFAKNGGEGTLKALKSSVSKEQSKQPGEDVNLDVAVNSVPDMTRGTGKGNHSNKETIYYY